MFRHSVLVFTFVALLSCSYAQFDLSPKGVENRSLQVLLSDGSTRTIASRKAAFSAKFGFTGNKGEMKIDVAALPELTSPPKSFAAPFASQDIPGGVMYLVKLDKGAWRTNAEAQNVPEKKCTVAKLSGAGSSFIFDITTLSAGTYALVLADNKYAWPFIIVNHQ